MTPTTAAMIAAPAIETIALIGLWLRLRWRTEQQRGHRRYIVALAKVLPCGSSIRDLHGEGRSTQLTIGSTSEESR